MYEKSSQYFDLLHQGKDYDASSKAIRRLIQQHNPNAKTLLDAACGTGKHIEILQEYYYVEGLDISPELLEIARKRCPRLTFHLGNLMNFKLNRKFDIITCLFGSIGYLTTIESVESAIAGMADHLQADGILIIEPWLSPEKFWNKRVKFDVVDEPELKIVRMHTSKVKGRISMFDVNYLVGTPQGVRYFTELEELGLYTHEEYVSAFEMADLKVSYDEKGLFGYGLYIGIKNKR